MNMFLLRAVHCTSTLLFFYGNVFENETIEYSLLVFILNV